MAAGQAWLDRSAMPLSLPCKKLEFGLVQVGEGVQSIAHSCVKYDNKNTDIRAGGEWCKETRVRPRCTTAKPWEKGERMKEQVSY